MKSQAVIRAALAVAMLLPIGLTSISWAQDRDQDRLKTQDKLKDPDQDRLRTKDQERISRPERPERPHLEKPEKPERPERAERGMGR